ncbi:MAG TPA: DUF4142 domain-containing protein, partial [Nitrospira sp.]|nr:DUF4142 domain-containing protein [Nitrospira sp.]
MLKGTAIEKVTIMLAALAFAATAAAFIPASGAQGTKQEAPSAHSFLQKAAEGQQAEIALGELASERAADHQVKQFGEQMMKDHQKASSEIRQLASKEGVLLPTELTGKHKDAHEQFARLSG